MSQLKNEQIELIRRDIERRGLLYPPLREEIIDHMCDAVEAEMAGGLTFVDAYRKVLAAFGPRGLSALNDETIHAIGTPVMIRNYFKIALRNLRRHKLHASINLLGLVLGISSCLFILLYVHDELSYDRFHVKGDRIFRMSTRIVSEGSDQHVAWGNGFFGPLLEKDFPEVEQVIRLKLNTGKITVGLSDSSTNAPTRLFSLDKVYYVADPAFFRVFTYPLLAGNPATALAEPHSVVITEQLAQQYFSSGWNRGKGIIGKPLDFNGDVYQVTGVMRKVPTQTDLPFNALLSIDEQRRQNLDWCITYVLFRDAESGKGFGPKLKKIEEKLQPEFAKNGATIHFYLENLRDVHFSTPKLFDTPKSNRAYLSIFSVVAAFILLIACINYVNLSIAQSAVRSVEVGIRKVVGAARVQLLLQFIGESVLLTLGAVLLSLLLVELSLPWYNQFTGKSFSLVTLFDWRMALLVLGIFILVGIVAGSYPAFYLASFDPVKVLKGRVRLGRSSVRTWLRQGLVVLQFSISIAMIIGTLIVFTQMRYLQTKNLGFHKDQVVVIDIPDDRASISAMPGLRQRLAQYTSFRKVALSGYNSLPSQDTDVDAFGLEKGGQWITKPLNNINLDEHYLELLQIPLLAGRNFAAQDTVRGHQGFIVNEALVRMMGWQNAEQALGRRVNVGQADDTPEGTIIGVVKDFHFHSLHKTIEPMVLLYGTDYPEKLLVSLPAGELEDHLSRLRAEWKKFVPRHPFEFTFLDTVFDQQYRNERRLMPIFTYFSFLTVFIACLGLFGLVSFSTQQRTKEIGIRKVMGAPESRLIYLLSREYIGLVALSVLIASPLAWFAMQHWLQNFAYRTEIRHVAFLLAGIAALGIALLTTGYHTLRAARTNPVKALRYE
jgi:putative ABC transport system permease protein